MKAKVLPNVNGVNCINGVDGEKWSKEYRREYMRNYYQEHPEIREPAPEPACPGNVGSGHSLSTADHDRPRVFWYRPYQLQCILWVMLTIRIDGDGPIGNLGCLGETGQNRRALSPVFLVLQKTDAIKIPDPVRG